MPPDSPAAMRAPRGASLGALLAGGGAAAARLLILPLVAICLLLPLQLPASRCFAGWGLPARGLRGRARLPLPAAQRAGRDAGPGVDAGGDDDELEGQPFQVDDDVYDSLAGPPDEVLNEWEQDEVANEILKNFQSEELAGKDLLSFRDVYTLLEMIGMERTEFVMSFTEEYEGEDDEDFFDDEDEDDEDLDMDFDDEPQPRKVHKGRPP
mmetsp:Transcript_88225/g.279056  ORF Transcript_88225/g.279056 Transcript_88225/m.279056 type:complete len:210 (+) Transcript_88225:6-635(+)|eukprot:CAMPEP_0175671980 /NCGR_PEP_ID=MMETSP0097-20121207/20454_1 /TAXON_ID=311494 /ORGANISM="Alexandrium monilatum, Strain CCMP3105" /LENGTH=209 /DNA_ID=CAMNT_0016978601 /DNA_START=1 /DNA_END=630 /DNA_ORIENTATION=+